MWKIRLTFIDSDLLYKSVLSQVLLHKNICIVKMILMCKLNISKSEINYYWFIEGLLILWSLKCDLTVLIFLKFVKFMFFVVS